MHTAIKVFFDTSRELDQLRQKARSVRVSNIEHLVNEFRAVLTDRAVAAEALDLYDQAEIRAIVAELNRLDANQEPHSASA